MGFEITKHAREEMNRRGISEIVVESVLKNPEQIVNGYGNKKAYQSRVDSGTGKSYLVRVIVDDSTQPARIVTVYKTSKIEKYWSKS